MDKNIKKEKEMAVSDYDYFLDDSKMPSAEESKKIEIPEELRKRMSERIDKELRKLGYY
ncbi:MAG: hypothetical protein HXL86_08640 [[Eubacterium] sulci]|jgi:hypothetical protein|nr:hypothetical protein [[Eubacterium] sulci]MBF1178209.1 hypothetical protein [[Eubacterium] sulci]